MDRSKKNLFDATILTQKILSCVYRLDQKYGIPYVISVLRGSKSKRVLANNHQKISTYAIVTEYFKDQLEDSILQLVKLNYLEHTKDRYPILKLTKKSVQVLKGKEKVFLQSPPTWFEIMKRKAEKEKRFIFATLSLFNQGRSLTDIGRIRKLTENTVVEHIELAAALGERIDISKLISKEKQETIKKAFQKQGIERLTPVKEKLGQDYSYDELKLVRVAMLSERMTS